MPTLLNLEKGKEALKLSLEKRGVATPPSADLAFVLDVSGSFDHMHRSGATQQLLERLVPWGMLFDPDQKLDVFTFSNGSENAVRVGDITPATCGDYIQNKIIGRVAGYGCGTDYGYVIEKVLQQFGWIKQKGSLLGRLLGTNKETQKRRSIVLFVTDGDNGDKSQCEQLLQESEARGDEIYFLFIAIGHPGSFPFLTRIADRFSNTGFVTVDNLNKFVAQSDEETNNLMIGDELVTWLKK